MIDLTVMQAGAGALTALAQYGAGQSAVAQGDYLAGQDNYRARVALRDAQDRAQFIRRAGTRAVGTADTVAAANGVQVGTGSAGEVDHEIYQASEHDAYTALLSGSRTARAFEVDAVAQTANAKAKKNIATAQLVGTVLSSGYSAYRSWGSGGGGAFDLGGVNGTNDRGRLSVGSNGDWFQKYGRSGD